MTWRVHRTPERNHIPPESPNYSYRVRFEGREVVTIVDLPGDLRGSEQNWVRPFHALGHHARRNIAQWARHGDRRLMVSRWTKPPTDKTTMECLRIIEQFEAGRAGPTPKTEALAQAAFNKLKEKGAI